GTRPSRCCRGATGRPAAPRPGAPSTSASSAATIRCSSPTSRTTRGTEDDAGDRVGQLSLGIGAGGVLQLEVTGDGNRVRWDAPCTGDDAFAGLGSHVDVDHTGEAFPLWVSEPGIGKADDDELPDDWFLTGTKHATSFPDPFLLRPEPLGLALAGAARVEVDLCTGDRWTVDAWRGSELFLLFEGISPLEIVQTHALAAGAPVLPPDWAFAPWNDAVGGADRVRTVAGTLRAAGAPSSVVWTEDWKGGEETSYGYHLTAEWTLDEALYPDAVALDAELEAAGFKWLAYFSPFLGEESAAWAEAEDLAIRGPDGEPYLFDGITFDPTSVLDLSRQDARDWAVAKMDAALALGFDGWMLDFAEWLPPDAVLAGADAMEDHNRYPLWWQATNAAATAGSDAVTFSRSGWTGTSTLSPVTWAGDQRTSFDADDGFPTVLPLGIGAGIAGVPIFTHDIAGYSSIGNPPTTKELWFRWCTLGALSPVMRTHHGAFKDDNWQFDSDAETLAHYARWGAVHTRLFPYLRGLAGQAASTGRPLVLAPFLLYPDEPWGRTDVWMLGSALLVAPVLEMGAAGREVDLPAATPWYDFWTGAPVESGWFDVPVAEIATFAPAGAIVPMFVEAPDTLVTGALDGLTTLDDADPARVVHVFAGAAGAFTEADGTAYETDG
ncbi:MAG: TIM-barrel domain-containing protein, partial [Myxococcota bacterium]